MSPEAAQVDCDVIVVTYNQLEYTRLCLESLLRHTQAAYRLIIVDNASEASVVEYLQSFQAQHPHVELILNPHNAGWVRAVNQGVRRSSAPYVCWMNNDTVVTEGWLTAMLEVAATHSQVGLLNPSWSVERETLPAFLKRAASHNGSPGRYQEIGECNGACLLVTRQVIERIGLLDEVYETGGFDDSDFSRRATKAGFSCVEAASAFVYHWQNVSINRVPDYWHRERASKRRIFQERWGPPRQIVVVWDGEAPQLRGSRESEVEVVVGLARLGLVVHVWIVNHLGRAEAGGRRLEDVHHANIKVSRFWSWRPLPRLVRCALTQWWCMALLAARRTKRDAKRYKAVIVESSDVADWIRMTRWLHGVEVHRSFATCPLLAQELRYFIDLTPRRETLSVVLITKNEARQMTQCLDTVAWADELIVVDDESTDETVSLCRRYTARVITHRSNGDFDGQRNIGIDQATGDWILQMDADERVPEALHLELELLLRSRPPAHGLEIRRINWFLGRRVRYGGWDGWGLKLFRRGAARYVGKSVHETLRLDGARDRCEAPIEHYPYRDLSQIVHRTNFYSSVQARVMSEEQQPTMQDVRRQLLRRPVKIFWKLYVKKQGYREGFTGLLFSVLFSWGHWMEWVKYWERMEWQLSEAGQSEQRGAAWPTRLRRSLRSASRSSMNGGRSATSSMCRSPASR